MPNIKSQKDRVVQAVAEQAHNKAIKTNLKTVVKKADAAIDANAADKDATVLAAVSAIDKARAKGVIKKNTASRKISRMAKRPDTVSPEVKFELGTEIYHIALKMRHAGPASVCITASGILGKEVFPRLTRYMPQSQIPFYRHTRIEDVARHNTSHGSQMSKRLAVGIAQIKASAYAAAQFHPVNVILCLALPRETQPQ